MIDLKIEGSTAIVTIDREQQMNALNKEVLSALKQQFGVLRANEKVRGIIVTGAGERAFVAGADIKEFVGLSREEGTNLSRLGNQLMDEIASFPKPVIAAINGYALGGGLELALACHIRIAVEGAKIGFPEVSLGLIPGYGGTQRLPQLTSKGIALEMIMSGEMVDARRAVEVGIINKAVAANKLIHTSLELLESIYAKGPNAVSKAIDAINAAYDERNGFEVEVANFGACFGTSEFEEGVQAFLSKRKPNF